jgi:hypothetical protein
MAKFHGDVCISFHVDEIPTGKALKGIKWTLELAKGGHYKILQDIQDEFNYPGYDDHDGERQSVACDSHQAINQISEFEKFLDLLIKMSDAVERHT